MLQIKLNGRYQGLWPLPPDAAPDPVFDASPRNSYIAVESGKLKFFETSLEGLVLLRYNQFEIKKDLHMEITMMERRIELYFTLTPYVYSVDTLGEFRLSELRMGLQFIPNLRRSAALKADQLYKVFSIVMTVPYFKQLCSHFHRFEFIQQLVNTDTPFHFCLPNQFPATLSLCDSIHTILNCNYQGSLKTLYLHAVVKGALIGALTALTKE